MIDIVYRLRELDRKQDLQCRRGPTGTMVPGPSLLEEAACEIVELRAEVARLRRIYVEHDDGAADMTDPAQVQP